jgi:hypothetical protein
MPSIHTPGWPSLRGGAPTEPRRALGALGSLVGLPCGPLCGRGGLPWLRFRWLGLRLSTVLAWGLLIVPDNHTGVFIVLGAPYQQQDPGNISFMHDKCLQAQCIDPWHLASRPVLSSCVLQRCLLGVHHAIGLC